MVQKRENAVSPVIGIMLMLVVTIIIAAVVSGFAGGLTSGNQKTPQASIKADYSITNGMTITHNGGDPLAVGEFTIVLTPSKNYGSVEAQTHSCMINQTIISNSEGTYWYNAKGGRDVSRFASGETGYIDAKNCTTQNLTPSMLYISSSGKVTNYGINQTKNIGSTFYLDFISKDGKRISRAEVPITS